MSRFAQLVTLSVVGVVVVLGRVEASSQSFLHVIDYDDYCYEGEDHLKQYDDYCQYDYSCDSDHSYDYGDEDNGDSDSKNNDNKPGSPNVSLAPGQRQFTKDFLKVLSEKESGNLFFSPFSIYTAMAMVQLGARGNTEKQIRNALYFPASHKTLKQDFYQLLNTIKGEEGTYELDTSNSVYVSKKLGVVANYINDLKKYFKAASKSVDFSQSEAVRKQINDKVEIDTRSKIKELIPEGALSDLTRMVLVNAVYFKGNWQQQFKKENTRERNFRVTSDSRVKTPMMYRQGEYKLKSLDNMNADALSLPYKGNRINFLVILPREVGGISSVQSKLADINLTTLMDNVQPTKVRVTLPKFKLEQRLKLKAFLQQMGVEELFDKADLSGISRSTLLRVSEIFHKSFIEVNEEGSEAAAATGVVITRRSAPRYPTFTADRPFLFFIIDSSSKQILFMGRYATPN